MSNHAKVKNQNKKKKHVPLHEVTIGVEVVEKSYYKFYLQAHSKEEALEILESGEDIWDNFKHVGTEESDIKMETAEVLACYMTPQRIPLEHKRESDYMCYECNFDGITPSHKACPECKKPIEWVNPGTGRTLHHYGPSYTKRG